MADPGPLKRTLYPPSHKEKGPSPNGKDIEAVKRAISRAGFWKWVDFDQAYTDLFAHGDDDGDRGPGVSGFQYAHNIDATGTYGTNTHEKLRGLKIPKKRWDGSATEHPGDPVWDQTAADMYKGYSTAPDKTPIERVRAKITEFCEKAINEPWNYSQNRVIDISVDPDYDDNNSDCSGSVIQAFHYAKRETGLAVKDPAKQGWSGYGNTSYYEDDHPTVSGSYLVGDLAHYDGHVCCCFHPGNADTADWFSFGSEPPSKRKLHYRDDFRKVVRPPLL